MSNFKNRHLLKITIPIFAGVVFLFIPLIGDFHFESALVVSLVGCFWAGIRACDNSLRFEDDLNTVLQIGGHLFLVGLPLLLAALLTGCFSVDGLAFWLLFPLPSVFFGYAIGRLIRTWSLPNPRALTVFILLSVAVGIFLYELLNYPQVYFFNHVWGGWPGPIYDETVRINGATLFFRILTIVWTVLLWHMPTLHRDRMSKLIVGLAAISIVFSYPKIEELGVVSPRQYLQNVLGGYKSTEHFELYYDKQFYSDFEIDLLAAEHEFYLQQISEQLELPSRDSTEKIESYLYAHPWQKKELVGAKFTSYVPVWLEQDQLHIAKQQIESSLKHELVHVLAKQFGNDLFNGSWSIGLIEGIAVALNGGSSSTSTVDQIVVSEKPYPSAKELEHAFSIQGFYGGRSGVNYITSGSFVRFLMNNYPIESLKKAYQSGSFENAYPNDWKTMTNAWHRHLDSVRVDSVDQKVAGKIFGIPSLFEQKCPHIVSDFAAAWDAYKFHLANFDTTKAMKDLDRAVAKSDSMSPVKSEWAYRNLTSGYPKKVQQAASLQDTTMDLQLLYADAFALTQTWNRAQKHLQRGQQLLIANPDSMKEPAVVTRMDSLQWSIYRKLTYKDQLPDSATFAHAYYRTKIRSLQKAIDKKRWEKFELYARQLARTPLHQRYFDDYLQLIHHLAFKGNIDLAKNISEKLMTTSLRNRYIERLHNEQQWFDFLKSISE